MIEPLNTVCVIVAVRAALLLFDYSIPITPTMNPGDTNEIVNDEFCMSIEFVCIIFTFPIIPKSLSAALFEDNVKAGKAVFMNEIEGAFKPYAA